MTVKGIDTTFLVQVEVRETQDHQKARALFEQELVKDKRPFALAPQVLAEFLHIVTDNKRFERPLTVPEAIDRALLWWNAKEVVQIIPGAEATLLTYEWLKKYHLGRKRILDTQLAATYYCAGIAHIISSNARDFHIYECFTILNPARQSSSSN